MLKVILLKGLPGSGKSTFAKEEVLKNTSFIRVNRDDIRNMLGPYWMPSREGLVTDIEKTTAELALHNGYSVIYDATNFHPSSERFCRELAIKHNAEFSINFFETPLEECIKRDALREKPVGRDVICNMYNKYQNQFPSSTVTFNETKQL